MRDDDPQPLFDYVVAATGAAGLAYIHVIEGATGGPREIEDRPFDYARLRKPRQRRHGQQRLRQQAGGRGDRGARADDLVAFGRPFIANPDLVGACAGAPLNAPDKATFYGGGAKGYTDYPALEATQAAAVRERRSLNRHCERSEAIHVATRKKVIFPQKSGQGSSRF